jgi:hypothetical protein
MKDVVKKLSLAAFLLALICFFLPFVTFSCQGQTVASLSGIQLATGTKIQQPQVFGPPKEHKVDAEPLATAALLSVLAALVLSFLREKKWGVGSAALAALGVILLAALKSKLDGDTLRHGEGVIQVSYGAGYYLCLVFLLSAVGTSIYSLMAGKGDRMASPLTAGDTKFCTQCGTQNAASNLFCKKCGSKFD